MDIKQLEAFCMVVRQGSFSRAANTHQQEHTAYG